MYDGDHCTHQTNWSIDLTWQVEHFPDIMIGVFFQCRAPSTFSHVSQAHRWTWADALRHSPVQLTKTVKYNDSSASNNVDFFLNIVDKFQVSKHMLFHFSKPSLVIIYDLETNHDCLCLGYFPVDLFNRKCHFTSVRIFPFVCTPGSKCARMRRASKFTGVRPYTFMHSVHAWLHVLRKMHVSLCTWSYVFRLICTQRSYRGFER